MDYLRGVLCGLGLNLLARFLLLVVMPMEYWTYGQPSSVYYNSPRLNCGALRHNLRYPYLSGFVHLESLVSLFGGWNDYRHRKGEVLKPLDKLLPLFLGVGIFSGITTSLTIHS